MHFTRAISIVILLINFYVFCYGFFKVIGLVNPYLVEFLLRFGKAGLLYHSYVTKLVSFALLGVSCVGATGQQTEEITWKKTIPYLMAGPLLFFGADALLFLSIPVFFKGV